MLCRDCGNNTIENRSMCVVCLDKARSRTDKRRKHLLSQNKCISCGKKEHIKNKELCEDCNNNKIKSNEKRKHKYKEENKCGKCARSKSNVLVWYNLWCAGCHLKYKMGLNCSKEEAENIINNMLIKQDFKCALSGRDLKTNKYHIDHIKPRSLFPELKSDINNWQLVVEDVNVFKKDLSINNIIKLAEDIVNFNRNKK